MANLPEVDTSFVRPLNPVTNNSVAEGIQGLGTIALEANRQIKGEAIQEEFQSEVDSFGKQVDRLSNMKRAGLSEDQFRTRAESILKSHIARAPALADEFRNRARGVLGFDPTGAAVQEMFNAQNSEAKKRSDIEAAQLAQAKAWDMDVTQFGTSTFNQQYTARQRLQQDAAILQTADKLDSRDLPIVAGSEYQNLQATMNNQSLAFFGKTIPNLTDFEIAQLPTETRAAFIGNLEAYKNGLRAKVRADYPGLKASDVDSAIAPVLEQVDYYVDRLKPGEDSAKLKNINDTNVALLKNKFLGTPEGRALAVIAGMSEAAVGPLLSQRANSVALKLAQGTPLQAGDLQDTETADALAKGIDNWMSNVDLSKATPVEKEAANVFMQATTETMAGGGLTPNTAHKMLEAFANPKTAKFLSQLPADSESTINAVRAARDYAVKSSIAAGKDLVEEINFRGSFLRANIGGKDPKDLVRASVLDGLIRVEAASSDGQARAMAKRMQNNYARRINTATKALSNVMGISNKEASEKLFQSNPGVFSWLNLPEKESASE